jgi:acetyl-CoA synthetase
MSTSATAHITSVLKEKRSFPPPPEFAAAAHIKSMAEYERLWQRSKDDPQGFWAEQAESLQWMRRWDKVLVWNEPHAQWFVGGRLNVSANCLDRHLAGPRRNKAAIIWEGEPGDSRVFTYQMLHREVCKFANVLKKLGIQPGDRVTLYMPMVPELAIAMLACARIGAVHSVVFGGFSACSSPPTAAGGAAKSCRSNTTSIRHWQNHLPSKNASSSIAAINKWT